MTKLVRLIIATAFVLSAAACAPAGLSEADKELCGQIKSNLDAYQTRSSFFEAAYFESDTYQAIVKGNESRDIYLGQVEKLYPWILDLPTGSLSEHGYFYELTNAELWQIASKGTVHEFVLTDQLRQRFLENQELTLDELLTPKPSEVIGNDYDNTGCAPYDAWLEENSGSSLTVGTRGAYTNLESLLRKIVEQTDVIKQCKETGKYLGDKCAQKDYVSTNESVDSCKGKLLITANSAEYGDCGTLTFTIFQADLNTGDYRALGWWTDKNGNEQVGMFMIAGLQEGSTYTAKVSVGRETTYTNDFGAEKTVVTFLEE